MRLRMDIQLTADLLRVLYTIPPIAVTAEHSQHDMDTFLEVISPR